MEHIGVAVEQVESREAYRNPWLTVREDVVRWPDGVTGIYGVIDKRDFALVVPWEEGGFHLVEQYRYPVRTRCWEFPQGGWPPGETVGTSVELARKELAEETGLRAASWTKLGWLQSAPGVMNQGFDVFLASDLTAGASEREATEQDMRQNWVSLAEFERMVRAGEIQDSHTIAAYSLFRLFDSPFRSES